MKLKFIIISFLILALPQICFAEDTVFINGFEDLPLMNGMSIVEDAGISFDSLSGSIVEVYAESPNINPDDVFTFYKKTLPQLGWNFNKHEKKISRFSREGQVLTIEYLGDSPSNTFRFETRPTL